MARVIEKVVEKTLDEKLADVDSSFTKQLARKQADLDVAVQQLESTRSETETALADAETAFLAESNLTTAERVEVLQSSTKKLLNQCEARIRQLQKKVNDCKRAYDAEITAVKAGHALGSKTRHADTIVRVAQARIDELHLLATTAAEDAAAPIELHPKPSVQVVHALDCTVREHFKDHIQWLKHIIAVAAIETPLRALAIKEIDEPHQKALQDLEPWKHGSGIPPLYATMPDCLRHVQHKADLDAGLRREPPVTGNAPAVVTEAEALYERMNGARNRKIAALREKHAANVAAVQALSLDELIAKHAETARDLLQTQAEQAAAAAREIHPTTDEIKRAWGLLGAKCSGVDEARRFAVELNAENARECVLGSPIESFVVPQAPDCPKPTNLEWYKDVLAPYLEPAQSIEPTAQQQCAMSLAKEGVVVTPAKPRPSNQIPSLGEMRQLP